MSEKLKNSSSEKVHDVGVDGSDSEAYIAPMEGDGQTLHRTMKNRHIAMIRYVFLPTFVVALFTFSIAVLAVSSALVSSWVPRARCSPEGL